MKNAKDDIISIETALLDKPPNPFMIHAGIRTFDDVKVIMRRKLMEMSNLLERRLGKTDDDDEDSADLNAWIEGKRDALIGLCQLFRMEELHDGSDLLTSGNKPMDRAWLIERIKTMRDENVRLSYAERTGRISVSAMESTRLMAFSSVFDEAWLSIVKAQSFEKQPDGLAP